ncbi:MAG: carbohydrate binding domain-containing protein [Paraprevotella sp.]|nr:carbohydrate binding domain-containing protein [Paraprevotella sp.]
MKIKKFLLGAGLCAFTMASLAQDNTVTVQTKKLGAPIQPTMYGVFFEDINFGADGGLYAELIKNRSFEFRPDHFMGWEMFGNITLKNDGPFDKNPHYVRMASAGHNDKWTGIQNEGFFGIGLKKDAEYRFSVWARVPEGNPMNLLIQFIDQNTNEERQQFMDYYLQIDSKEWKKYEVILKSPRTLAKANLRIFMMDKDRRNAGSGIIDVEHVSLFPVDTWNGHKNGMRKDLAQALYDMQPGVFRFPGGCIVEGADLATRYQWKHTVGPVENRPLNNNRWESTFNYRYFPDYFQSYGLGFYEYFLLSEEIGAEPLPVLNVGMACQYQNWNNEKAHATCTQEGLQPYIDDCLDLIEFANGSVDTKWGKVRAEMGHPAPFNMKYLAIGNEQWGEFYFERLKLFVEVMREKHPEILIIGTSGPDSEGHNFDIGWAAMKEQKADLVDEHFYRPIDWFKNSMNRYDDYDRTGPKVFAGEYACHDRGKKWNHAGASIYEAAFMTTIERNADIVHMATYAPLFAHVEGWQWRPDLIWFDNLRSVKTVSYYVQQMYAKNKGTHVLATTLSNPTPKGEDGVFASAVWDADTQEYVVKVINTTAQAKTVAIKLEGVKKIASAVKSITLNCSDYDLENTVDNPNAILPQENCFNMEGTTLNTSIAGKNFVVYRIKK